MNKTYNKDSQYNNNNRDIEWYIFELYIPNEIDWTTKKIKISKRIDRLLVNFQTLFKFNLTKKYYLENISCHILKDVAIKEFIQFKNIPLTTFQISTNNNYTNIKQGILLITNKMEHNYIVNINNKIYNDTFKYSKFLIINILKINGENNTNIDNKINGENNTNIDNNINTTTLYKLKKLTFTNNKKNKSNLNKLNLIDNLLETPINYRYFNDIISLNKEKLYLYQLLNKSKPYCKILFFEYIINNKHMFKNRKN